MKGLLIVALPIDTAQADPQIAMKVALEVAKGVGMAEMGEPQAVGKQFHEGDPAELPREEDGEFKPERWVTANDHDHLQALGFDPERLGINVVGVSLVES